MTEVFYDPQNKQITIAVSSEKEIALLKEEDTWLLTVENVENIEFFWPDERIWRAVK